MREPLATPSPQPTSRPITSQTLANQLQTLEFDGESPFVMDGGLLSAMLGFAGMVGSVNPPQCRVLVDVLSGAMTSDRVAVATWLDAGLVVAVHASSHEEAIGYGLARQQAAKTCTQVQFSGEGADPDRITYLSSTPATVVFAQDAVAVNLDRDVTTTWNLSFRVKDTIVYIEGDGSLQDGLHRAGQVAFALRNL